MQHKKKSDFKGSPALLGNQRGIGVISILITIVIFLVVLTGVFAMVGRTSDSAKLQQAQQDVAAIQMSTRQVYSSSTTYAGLDNATAINAGILPESMVSGGSGLNPWGGAITVAVNGSDSTEFDITYAGLPQDICIKMASFGQGNWEAVTANGTTIPQDGSGVISAASGACTASSSIIYTSK